MEEEKEMKRVVECIVLVGLMIGLLGCNSSVNSEEVLKKAEEKGYTVAVLYNSYENYYSLDGTCLNSDLEQDTCKRINTDLDTKNPSLIFMKDEDHKLSFFSGNEGVGISAFFDGNSYVYSQSEESVRLMEGAIDTWCTYYYQGGEDDDKKCADASKKDADKIKEQIDNLLDEIGLSQKDITDFYNTVKEHELNDLINSLKKVKENQKELTNSEIKKMIENEYTIDHNDKGNLTLTRKQSTPIIFTYMDNGIMLYDDLYSGKYSDNKMTIAYMFDTKSYVSLNGSSSCGYDVTNAKTLDGKTCSSSQIKDAEMLQYSFEREIELLNLTLDEFISFMKSY